MSSAVALDAEPEPLEVGRAQSSGSISHPEQPLGPRPRAGPTRCGGGISAGDVDRARDEPRAADLDHQPRGDPLRAHRQLGMQLLLEAVGRLGAQAELARGAQDVDPVPGRDLEQHAGRRVGDLGDLRRP